MTLLGKHIDRKIIAIIAIAATVIMSVPIQKASAAVDCTGAPAGVGPGTYKIRNESGTIDTVDGCVDASGRVYQYSDDHGWYATTIDQKTGEVVPPAAGDCSGTWSYTFNLGTCLFRTFLSGIGALLISVAALFLTLAGLLFNWLIDHTIILFATSIYGKLQTGIETTWTVFRDLSNIAIIGIFVFIAISIILGIKQFGDKRMIANVLIIAILINFSLLFTKVIIDGSNYMALQFYTASTGRTMAQAQAATASGGGFSVTGTGADLQQFPQEGVAGSFVKILGVTTLSDTYNSLNAIAQRPDGGAVTAFLHGLFGALLLLGAGIVLLYGSYLVVVRAVLLLFLLITSGLAFASYLLPKSIRGEFGWSTWWSSLLKAAVFAPMLMLFLWMTLTLATAINQGKTGTLGNLITNPGKAADLGALFVYIIVLALLFTAFRVASSFSNSIAGFNWASTLTAAPFTLGSKYFLAPFGRQIFGRLAGLDAQRLADEISSKKKDVAKGRAEGRDVSRELKQLKGLQENKAKAEATAKSSFNMMNNKALQTLATGLGVKGFAIGADKKALGYADAQKIRAEAAAKAGAELSVSKEDARKEAEKQFKGEKDSLNAKIAQTEKEAKASKERAEEEKRSMGLQEKHNQNMTRLNAVLEEAAKNKVSLDDKLAGGAISREEHQAGMRSEEDRIAKARREIQPQISNVRELMDAIDRKHGVTDADAELRTMNRELGKLNQTIEAQADKIVGASKENAQDMAELMTNDAYTSKLARELTGKKISAKGAKARQEADVSILEDAGEKPPTEEKK